MNGLVLIQGDACHIPLHDGSVHACVCSPPYFGLRAYESVAPTCWPGGTYAPSPGAPPLVIPGPSAEEIHACAHVWKNEKRHIDNNNGNASETAKVAFNKDSRYFHIFSATCEICHCWLGTLGNEGDQEITETVYELKEGLTADEIAYVIQELAKAGITLDGPYGRIS